jgi:anti-anti-sigma factor
MESLMSVLPTTQISARQPLGAVAVDETDCHTASMETFHLADTVLVVADGAIDAVNAAAFASYALRDAGNTRGLVIDLTRLEFFGIEGFSALNTISVRCAASNTAWAIATSPAVARVLRVCDPASAMPCASTLAAAQLLAQPEPEGRLLQLVPQTS